jgi:hypothetical protein
MIKNIKATTTFAGLERNGINRYKEQVGRLIKTAIGTPAQWLIEAAASIGLDITGLAHEVTDSFISHVFKQHGDEKTERARGQVAVTSADIGRISDIVKTPDCAIIGIRRDSETLIAYAKKYDNNTTIYYEEVLTGKKNKVLRSKTMFIKMGDVSNGALLNIVGNHAHADISGVKMVVGAGGHPDGGTQ